jgi:hypothetical protein
MKTAVEFLFGKIKKELGFTSIELEKIFEQAKEMEKQQIIDAADWNVTEWQLHDGEQYYNETFNKK